MVTLTTAGLDVAGSQQQVHCVGSIWNLVFLDCAVHSGEDLIVCQCPSLQHNSLVRIALRGIMPGSARPRLPVTSLGLSSAARGVWYIFASPVCPPNRQHAALAPSLCLKEGTEGWGQASIAHGAGMQDQHICRGVTLLHGSSASTEWAAQRCRNAWPHAAPASIWCLR
jgi:hypothetical protein